MIADRKDDHVRHAVDQRRADSGGNDFDCVTFVHHALAGIDSGEVSLAVDVAGKQWDTPLYVNAMTGGSAKTGEINRKLAVAARETGIPIAAGSMSAFFRDPAVADTYRVLRRENPHGFVMANVNATASLEQVLRAIELLEADALQIHLNAVQEVVMPEGDRSFGSWPRQIEHLVAHVPIPVIVKEVGFGLSRQTVAWLRDAGVSVADVGGRGGTNFARIENSRRPAGDFAFLESWGQSTPTCLLDCAGLDGIDIAASGGIRSPLDIARALALGASATGVAGAFLDTVVRADTDALVAQIRTWLDQLRQILTVLGARTPADLAGCDLLITGEVASFCALRGIDAAALAHRSPWWRESRDRGGVIGE
ncbi:isopentenyl-diphosphate delta-isomerase [Nocardia neocaledoniensis NBRC 108232]|uniref:Isopentenyl-diphosphate delta-isomerase n=1 Tax=Nocardia neocaledoniensis TaxID=236511 RepID=A0A317N242_9NOCA|nr:type 2 isopentenyl-diphosphate Delta-isomerase [Nocardia neocaledoniensis]PWV68714.1 isopentenyl-diphosphate delta-isomerase [Nocardia neocaledoniensis]GEM33313.1 isopentenyl-diphosphate delta-isomerase [Nocardia neocaledoniensis NBRC 108232]